MCVYLHTYVVVKNLRSNSVTTNEITVMWDPAVSPSGCGPVFYYIVTAVNLMDSSTITMEAFGNVATIRMLSDGTTYHISVAAVNRAGTGPSSSMISVTTLINSGGKIIMFNNHE